MVKLHNISETETRKLLYSKQEAMEMLGVGEKTFRALGITFILIGKRKRYALADLQAFIDSQRRAAACLSPENAKAHPTIGTTSRSKVIGIEEARRQATLLRQKTA